MIDSILEILFEEDYTKTVAIYGGGFKPPTKGHFNVVEKTLQELPDIDELKLFVGGGVRNGVTQEESLDIWNIYKKYLSDKVSVEPSPKGEPAMDVIRYGREHPEEKVYWVLGAREGNEDDEIDIEKRTNILKKYPSITNIEVKVITSTGSISGTKTRKALSENNKEQFLNLIPDIDHREQDQIWNMLSSKIQESLEEGFIENAQENMKKLLLAIKQEGRETRDAFKLVLKAAKGEIQLTDEQKKQIGDQLKDVLRTVGLISIAALPGGFIVGALIKIFKAERLVFPSSLMNEVGEASAKVYPFSSDKDPSEIINLAKNFFSKGTSSKVFEQPLTYTFSTDKANYVVKFNVEVERQTYVNFSKNPDWKPGPPYKTYASVGFNIEGEEEDKDTNLNEQFSVLSTVTKIIFDFIDKINEAEGNLVSLVIAPKSDTGEESSLDSKRGRFYTAYIQKNLSKYPEYKTRDGKSNSGGEYVEIYKTNSINELEEGKQVGSLYHYTSVDGLKGILQSNKINASEEIYMGNYLYYISFTRNKNFHKKGSKFGVKTEYRITLDGDKLSNKYKIRPFAYVPGWDYTENWEYDWLEDEPENVVRDFFSATGDYDEQEERIFFKNETGGIDNIKNYILAVDKVEDLQENLIQETMTVYRLGEIPYDEDSFFVTPDYKTWIKYYPGEEIHKITTNKLYLPLRNKSFSSFDELRSKYEKGEFTEDDVSYINPEESGIQHFEQYEIRPDDIIDLEQINLQEGRKKKPDPKKGTGKKPEGSGRRLYTDENPKDTVSIKFKTKEDIVNTLNKASFKAKSHARQSQIINLIHQRVRAAYGKAKDPEVKSRLKRALDYIESRKEASKEKTERLRKMKEASDPQAGTALPYGSGFAPVKEAKELNIQDLAYKQIPGLLEKGINYELAHFRGFMKSSYKWSGPKDKNEFFDFIENIKGEIKRVPLSSIKPSQSGKDYKNSSSEYEAEEFQKILDGEKNIEDHRKEDFYPILVNKRDNKILDGNHRHYALSAINSPYAVALYVDVPKQYLNEKSDPFGLNKFAKDFVKEVFEETWNPKDSFLSLAVFMKDNGMNITPLPKIKVISDDKENASHLLGKTAYYNPADKSITLYTFGRHPKDVLRSFAHEMIHHEQNLNGTLGNVSTTNTNEDGHLDKLEREAYEKGNIMLRNWEDKIKSEKYLKEYKQYALTELFEKDLPNIEKVSPFRYIVGNGRDIEAEYYFRRIDIDNNTWVIGWSFTENNKNISPEAWKQVTATSFKILNNFIQEKKPKSIEISGNTNAKTNIYKSKSFLEKLENLFNNQYRIDNSDEDKVVMNLIENIHQSSIKKRMETLNESYEQALNYWQNGDIKSKSKIERWDSIKKKIKREVLQELYNLKPITLDIPKFNYPKTLEENLWHTLNEITLNPNNAAEIYGDLTNGKFQVGDIIYVYDIKQVKNPYDDGGDFYNIMFHPEGNITSIPQQGKENYIKILNTMYKIILDFTEEAEPEYVGIASLDNDGSKNYHTVYANLTNNKSNIIPGYFRKDVSLGFDTPQGKGRFVVLKRKDV